MEMPFIYVQLVDTLGSLRHFVSLAYEAVYKVVLMACRLGFLTVEI